VGSRAMATSVAPACNVLCMRRCSYLFFGAYGVS